MSPLPDPLPQPLILPRKGGGGHGGGGHGGGKSGGSKGSGGGGKSTSISISGGSGRKASTGSKGGGKKFKIASGAFAGREAGGGTRSTVYSGNYYGSGYPYGATGGWYIGQRPFPYVFWPVFIYPSYVYDSSPYGPSSNSSRPGGAQYATKVQATANSPTTYRILGDLASVNSVATTLVTNCKMVKSTPYPYDPTSNDTNVSLPKPEQIIQYYRASSFALSLDGYNNTFALPSNAPNTSIGGPKNLTMTPLPTNVDAIFQSCLNITIGGTIPLIQPGGLSAAAITGIILGSVFGVLFLWCCCKAFLLAACVGVVRNGWRKVRRGKDYQNLEKANRGAKHHEEQKGAMGHIQETSTTELIPKPSDAKEGEKS